MTLRGLWIHPRSGRPYYRRRAGGETRLVPLPPDLPHDHPDFLSAWADAARGDPAPQRPKAGTVASILAALVASDRWHGLSASYRGPTLGLHMREIGARYGALPLRAIADRHIRKDVADAGNPRTRLRAWRLLCGFALDHAWVHADASRVVRTPRRAPAVPHPPWTAEDVERFRARWPIGTVPRAAMELLHWTGARISDAVLIGPQHVGRDGVLTYTQTKTGQLAHVPWTCQLAPWAPFDADRALMIEALTPLAGQLTFLATQAGRPRSVKALGTLMRASCEAAGIDASAHGLRKSRAIAMIEAGATPHQAAAWTGHKTLDELIDYARDYDRRKQVIGTHPEQDLETTPRKVETRQAN